MCKVYGVWGLFKTQNLLKLQELVVVSFSLSYKDIYMRKISTSIHCITKNGPNVLSLFYNLESDLDMWSLCKNPKHSQKVLNAQFIRLTIMILHHIIRAITMQLWQKNDCLWTLKKFPPKKYWVGCSPKLTPNILYCQVHHAIWVSPHFSLRIFNIGFEFWISPASLFFGLNFVDSIFSEGWHWWV